MNSHARIGSPTHYELRIEGHLDPHWSAWFGGLTVIPEKDGTTTLRGVVSDQAELHGLLAKVRDLGVTLLLVRASDTSAVPEPGRGNHDRTFHKLDKESR